MGAQGQDPNRIDVSLNIMSDASLTAVNNLTNQLAGLRELIGSQGTIDPGSRAEGMSRAAQYVRTAATGTPGAVPNRPSITTTVDPSNPSQGAEDSRTRANRLRQEYEEYMASLKSGGIPTRGELSPEAQDMMARNISDPQRWRLAGQEKKAGLVGSRMDRFFELYQGTQRDPNENRAYEFEAGVPPTGGSALPEGMSAGGGQGAYPPQGPPTTSPMGGMGDMPGWAQTLQREGITPESRFGLTIPRLGEFTIQDKLNMAAQWMGRAAQRKGTFNEDTGQTDFGQGASVMGRTAASAAYMRDQSAGIVAINREFQRLRGFASGEEQSAEALGFSRESSLGDISILGAGMRLNLGFTSAAQREALHQELTQRRVQLAAGVSGEEAARIRQTVAGMGYSGNLNENLQYNLFKPLQQQGIAPETVAPIIDQGIRQGNVSITSLRDTMIDLARAARNANMTLEETTSAALQYSESVQQIGANYQESLRNAATFTRSGLDPRIASQAMQSPMMQGILSMQTGLPPQLQGIIGAPGVMQGMGQAIQQGLALGAPFLNTPDRTIKTESGETLTVSTGRDAQIAMAQQTTGIPRQIIERYMRNPNFLNAGGNAQAMVGQMQKQIQQQTTHERVIPAHYDNSANLHTPGRGGPRGRMYVGETVEDYHAALTPAQRQALEHGQTGDKVVQYDELEKQMLAMDPKNKKWTDRVRKIRTDHGDIADRLNTAQRIIGEATNVSPTPDYLVGLTDEARKILKIEKPKDRTGALPRANAGGAPANGSMQGPNFPSTTGGAFSYGSQGP